MSLDGRLKLTKLEFEAVKAGVDGGSWYKGCCVFPGGDEL